MGEQIRAQRNHRQEETVEVADIEYPKTDRDEELAALDALLDEIDSVLVNNSEEFVNQFIQQGGE